MTLSIRSTIGSALVDNGVNPENYSSLVEVVTSALQEREYTLVEGIINGAEDRYAYGSQAAELVSDLGFEQRPLPTPVVIEEPVTDTEAKPAKESGKKARLSRVEEQLVSLSKSVATLTRLAERHLGAEV